MSPEQRRRTLKLTRQHFELIAKVVKTAELGTWQREQLALQFMVEMQKTNNNFDKSRFLKACGV
jgi:hypothetical protein